MKTWISILALVCVGTVSMASAFAGDPGYDEGEISEPERPARPTLEGTWEIQNRYCYSGAPVRDAFVPGRDTMELTFRKDTFRSFSDVQGCIGYSSGDFDVRGRYLTMYINKQVSTCTRDRFVGQVSYPYELRQNRLTVTIGPIGYGGPCPQGDSLGVVYRRY